MSDEPPPPLSESLHAPAFTEGTGCKTAISTRARCHTQLCHRSKIDGCMIGVWQGMGTRIDRLDLLRTSEDEVLKLQLPGFQNLLIMTKMSLSTRMLEGPLICTKRE
nr:hypothetical protein [Tanacetum cinerariifolium]